MIHAIKSARAVALTITAALALSACATLDQEECLSVNWQELGQQDGAAGRPSNHIEQHRQACAKHKLPVGEQSWAIGWETGIRAYCTPENGLTVGRGGQSYANACPADLSPAFTSAYDIGKRVHEARTDMERTQSELQSATRKLADAKGEAKIAAAVEVETLRTRIFGAELRLQSAEATYDRYALRLQRGF